MKKVIIVKENIFQKSLLYVIVNGMHPNFFKRPLLKFRELLTAKRGKRLAHQHLEKIERHFPVKFGGIRRFRGLNVQDVFRKAKKLFDICSLKPPSSERFGKNIELIGHNDTDFVTGVVPEK